MEKISIIVPAYNIAPYLRECLDSLINQTYSNLEIILIDDQSTDGTVAICEEYQQKDSRIRFIQSTGKKPHTNRNLGIELTTGDYVMFVDGDDVLAETMVMDLYQLIQRDQADIACCLFYRIDEDGSFYFYSDPHNPKHVALEGYYSSTEWLHNEIKPVIGQIFYQAWGKLFKRSLFKQIEYPNHLYADDALTGWKLYLTANRISYINQPDYCWRMRKSSITNGQRPNLRMVINNAAAVQERVQFYPLINVDPTFLRKRWFSYLDRLAKVAQADGKVGIEKNAQVNMAILNKYLH